MYVCMYVNYSYLLASVNVWKQMEKRWPTACECSSKGNYKRCLGWPVWANSCLWEYCFLWKGFLTAEVAQSFGQFVFRVKIMFKFLPYNVLGYTMGDFFHKPIRSPWLWPWLWSRTVAWIKRLFCCRYKKYVYGTPACEASEAEAQKS
jgi:hypothetical protein